MAIKVFIDADILLDFTLKREHYAVTKKSSNMLLMQTYNYSLRLPLFI